MEAPVPGNRTVLAARAHNALIPHLHKGETRAWWLTAVAWLGREQTEGFLGPLRHLVPARTQLASAHHPHAMVKTVVSACGQESRQHLSS
jgi:hypothetical protein